MTRNQVLEFLKKVEKALDKIIVCYISIEWDKPSYENHKWHVYGKLTDEKNNIFFIKGVIYDFKGKFQLLDANNRHLMITNWISYKKENMEEDFESFSKFICENPFKYYLGESSHHLKNTRKFL